MSPTLGSLDAARVRTVLAGIRPLLPPDPKTPGDAPVLDVPTLHHLLASVRPGLQAARAAGAFLNVWTVAGLRRDEVRTTAVLAWLLDPNGSHGCGDIWLQSFWRVAHGGQPPFEIDHARSAATEVTPMGAGADRVDVAVEGDDFVVYVEVKIDAGLQPNQLARYCAAAEEKARLQHRNHWAVVLLSEFDHEPPPGCVRLRWCNVARAIETAAQALPQSALGVQLARQFAAHVARLH